MKTWLASFPGNARKGLPSGAYQMVVLCRFVFFISAGVSSSRVLFRSLLI